MRIVFFLILFLVSTHLKATWADQLLARLSLREKIGQLFVVATVENKADINAEGYFQAYHVNKEYIEYLIEYYAIGGLIYLATNNPFGQLDLTNHYQKLSELPLLICQDCEWGLNMRMPCIPAFPRQMTLGAIQDQSLIFLMGQEIARQCKLLGIHVNFAPVVDLNNNPLNPVINNRSFGQDKIAVCNAAIKYMLGMQSTGIIACAKHFPGHGDANIDSHHDLPTICNTLEHLLNYELYPFIQMIKNTIDSIMVAHLIVPAIDPLMPSSLSKPTIDYLKDNLNFNGLIITDGLGMGALTNYFNPGSIELNAFLAGNDILLCPIDVPRAVEFIEDAIKTGMVSLDELDRRVLKILRIKEKLGLHKNRISDSEIVHKELVNAKTLALKSTLYQKAITLVKNDGHCLPLAPDTEVIHLQIQGNKQNNFEQLLQQNLSVQSISEDIKNSTIIITVFGMNKFASQQFGVENKTIEYIKKLKSQNNKIILVLFGSPYSLSLFEQEDAILVCYKDDPDAQEAAAHVICGQLAPKGKIPIDASSIFKIGAGLSF